jgi:hypothetical protein
MRVIKAYKNRKEYSIESGAQESIDNLNSEMYHTNPEQLAIDLKENYPESYKTIKRHDPRLIVTAKINMVRAEIAKESDKFSGKFSL